TRGIGRDGCQKVCGVDECETDAVAEVNRSDGILHDLMMKQDHPGAPGRISQDRLEGAKLRRMNDADRIGEQEMARGIRIELITPYPSSPCAAFDQREDCVPDLCYLPSSTCGAALCHRAQQLHARAAKLNDTGRGIAFVLAVEKVVGVAHFMR